MWCQVQAWTYLRILQGGKLKFCSILKWCNSQKHMIAPINHIQLLSIYDALKICITEVLLNWRALYNSSSSFSTKDKNKSCNVHAGTSKRILTSQVSKWKGPCLSYCTVCVSIYIYIYIHAQIRHWYAYTCAAVSIITSSTAQGGGGNFKNRKPIGEIGCRESRMAERIHWWTERWLECRTIYLSIHLSVYLPICLLSLSLSMYLSIYLSF